MQTFNDLMREVLKDFQNCEVGEDNDGQLVIYTGLRLDENDMLKDYILQVP